MKCRNCISRKFKRLLTWHATFAVYFTKKTKNLKNIIETFILLTCNLFRYLNHRKFKMFGKSYEYRTGLSKCVSHLKDSLHYFRKKRFVKKDSVVLDIGSNDGTFLNFFKNTNLLIGIDPSLNKFKKFYNKKIIKINNFFSKKNLKKNLLSQLKFNLITSFAMFYDVDDPNSFCKDIKDFLKDDGIWAVEFSYLPLPKFNLRSNLS